VDHGNFAAAYKYLDGTQETVSETHAGWNSHKGRFNGDVGGEFFTQKRYVIGGSTPIGIEGKIQLDPSTVSWATYQGPMLPVAPNEMRWPDAHASSHHDLEVAGATAIARCAPTNPTASLSTFLGETIKEGIPKIAGSVILKWRNMTHHQRRKAIGEEYLNYQFGWVPFVNDLRDISHSITHAHDVLEQYERDSGRMVRRRYEFPRQYDSSTRLIYSQANPFISPDSIELYRRPFVFGQVYVTETVARNQWFSGAFTYVLPTGGGARDNLAKYVIEAKKTLGLTLTPATVWNLTPWSWAIDWFTNAGDVLSNIDAWIIDNQVLLYGYMMEHVVSTRTYTYAGPTGYQSSSMRPNDVTLVTETKQRIKATPYGFGISWDGLSTFQKSILAALGITHFR
jgi:hypothetical protein